MTQQPKKLLDQVRDAIQLKHYAYSTEKTYVYWAKRFVLYHTNAIRWKWVRRKSAGFSPT
jgi:hypothetical protein